MKDSIFSLPDGGQIVLRLADGQVYVYLDGAPLYGPIQPAMARRQLRLPLPDGRGDVVARLEYTDYFAASLNGVPLLAPGQKAPRAQRVTGDETIRKAANLLFIIAAFNFALIGLAYWIVEKLRESETYAVHVADIGMVNFIVAAIGPTILVILGLWARWDDRKAGLPLAIGGVIYLFSAFMQLIEGSRIGALIAGAIMTKLFTAAMAASAARGAHIWREQRRQAA